MMVVGAEQADPSLAHPFWEFQWQDVGHPEVVACSVVLFFSGVLCSAAGIGGGGVYVALLMVVGKLSPHNAVPLSKAIVFFGSVSSLVVNLRRMRASDAGGKRSEAKLVIDFDACRAVVPAALCGTFLGVVLNLHAKDHTIVVVLAMLLSLMTGLVLQTAWQQHCQEEAARQQLPRLASTLRENAGPAAGSEGDQAKPRRQLCGPARAAVGAGHGTPACLEEDGEMIPLVAKGAEAALLRQDFGAHGSATEPIAADALLASALMLVVVMSGVLRFHLHACRAEQQGQGTVGSCRHPVVETLFRGHLEHWMGDKHTAESLERAVISLPLWSCLALAIYFGHRAHHLGRWKVGRVIAYQATATVTGVLAGLVGVGGGLILSPFFLLTGMEPYLAVGTSATCVFFTSSSTTIQYVFTDRIIMPLAVVYGLVTLMASYTGTSLVHQLQDQFAGKRSYITLVVALGVALSAVLSLIKFIMLVSAPEAHVGS